MVVCTHSVDQLQTRRVVGGMVTWRSMRTTRLTLHSLRLGGMTTTADDATAALGEALATIMTIDAAVGHGMVAEAGTYTLAGTPAHIVNLIMSEGFARRIALHTVVMIMATTSSAILNTITPAGGVSSSSICQHRPPRTLNTEICVVLLKDH